MSGYYININLKTDDAASVVKTVSAIFQAEGFASLGDESAAAVVEDEDKLPDGDDWYGVIVSSATKDGWVTVYVDDWQDSGLLAKRLSQSLSVPALEIWVAEDIHWGYTYYENGEVQDRFAEDPSQVAETPDEITLYSGRADALSAILTIPALRFAQILGEAQDSSGQFAGGPLDAVAQAVSIPFEHLFTGYDYFFEDDPDDYADDLENWPQFRHLAFRMPPGRETLAE